MRSRFISFLPAIAWFLLSFYLLTMPGSTLPKQDWFEWLQVDKWVHIFLFGTLVCLCCWPFKKEGRNKTMQKALLFAVLALAYGIVMEFVQRYCVANRSFDPFDIVADGVGSFLPWLWLRSKARLKNAVK